MRNEVVIVAASRFYDCRMSAMDRLLPTEDFGSPVAQLEGQLSGGEIAHPAVAARPLGAIRCPEPGATKLPFGPAQRHLNGTD